MKVHRAKVCSQGQVEIFLTSALIQYNHLALISCNNTFKIPHNGFNSHSTGFLFKAKGWMKSPVACYMMLGT